MSKVDDKYDDTREKIEATRMTNHPPFKQPLVDSSNMLQVDERNRTRVMKTPDGFQQQQQQLENQFPPLPNDLSLSRVNHHENNETPIQNPEDPFSSNLWLMEKQMNDFLASHPDLVYTNSTTTMTNSKNEFTVTKQTQDALLYPLPCICHPPTPTTITTPTTTTLPISVERIDLNQTSPKNFGSPSSQVCGSEISYSPPPYNPSLLNVPYITPSNVASFNLPIFASANDQTPSGSYATPTNAPYPYLTPTQSSNSPPNHSPFVFIGSYENTPYTTPSNVASFNFNPPIFTGSNYDQTPSGSYATPTQSRNFPPNHSPFISNAQTSPTPLMYSSPTTVSSPSFDLILSNTFSLPSHIPPIQDLSLGENVAMQVPQEQERPDELSTFLGIYESHPEWIETPELNKIETQIQEQQRQQQQQQQQHPQQQESPLTRTLTPTFVFGDFLPDFPCSIKSLIPYLDEKEKAIQILILFTTQDVQVKPIFDADLESYGTSSSPVKTGIHIVKSLRKNKNIKLTEEDLTFLMFLNAAQHKKHLGGVSNYIRIMLCYNERKGHRLFDQLCYSRHGDQWSITDQGASRVRQLRCKKPLKSKNESFKPLTLTNIEDWPRLCREKNEVNTPDTNKSKPSSKNKNKGSNITTIFDVKFKDMVPTCGLHSTLITIFISFSEEINEDIYPNKALIPYELKMRDQIGDSLYILSVEGIFKDHIVAELPEHDPGIVTIFGTAVERKGDTTFAHLIEGQSKKFLFVTEMQKKIKSSSSSSSNNDDRNSGGPNEDKGNREKESGSSSRDFTSRSNNNQNPNPNQNTGNSDGNSRGQQGFQRRRHNFGDEDPQDLHGASGHPLWYQNYGWNELHIAVSENSVDNARTLSIKHPNMLEIRDNFGRTPIFYSFYFGYIEMTLILLECGALYTGLKDAFGNEPEYYALKNNHQDLIENITQWKKTWGESESENESESESESESANESEAESELVRNENSTEIVSISPQPLNYLSLPTKTFLLFGRPSSGKSAVGNCIFGMENLFLETDSSIADIKDPQVETSIVDGYRINIIESPAVSTTFSNQRNFEQLMKLQHLLDEVCSNKINQVLFTYREKDIENFRILSEGMFVNGVVKTACTIIRTHFDGFKDEGRCDRDANKTKKELKIDSIRILHMNNMPTEVDPNPRWDSRDRVLPVILKECNEEYTPQFVNLEKVLFQKKEKERAQIAQHLSDIKVEEQINALQANTPSKQSAEHT